jgi:hypothetical protein
VSAIDQATFAASWCRFTSKHLARSRGDVSMLGARGDEHWSGNASRHKKGELSHTHEKGKRRVLTPLGLLVLMCRTHVHVTVSC